MQMEIKVLEARYLQKKIFMTFDIEYLTTPTRYFKRLLRHLVENQNKGLYTFIAYYLLFRGDAHNLTGLSYIFFLFSAATV